MSRARTGVPLSLEHRRNIGDSIRGERNGFFGKCHSVATRKKISKARSKYKNEQARKLGKRAQVKEYQRSHRTEIAEQRKGYYYQNQKKILAEKQAYGKRTRKQHNLYQKLRKRTDIQYRLKHLLTSRLSTAIKRSKNPGKRGGSAVRDLGCTVAELKFYIEGQFKDGMTWENWSLHGWHIDHKIPLDFFDLTDPDHVKKACHYLNLQPLWARENIIKGNKILQV